MTLTDYFINNVQLQKQWSYDRNTVSTDDLTPDTRAKVWWYCDKGHEWQALLDSRVYDGGNCPYCTDQAGLPGVNNPESVDSEIVKRWHPTRNGSLKPTDIASGSRKQLWWQCENGHEWQARAYSIKAGGGCPYCFGRYAIPGETDLATTHPHMLEFWSGRNKLSPTEITAGSHKKVLWECGKGHVWEAAIVSVVLDGCGCPYCAGKKATPGETDLATLCPDVLAEWDYERNTLNPSEILPSAHSKVWWKCSLGHSWQAVVFSRTGEKNSKCPYCTGRLVLPGFNDLATLKPKVAAQWYEPLNGDLRPEAVTLGSNKKVWWQCADGHVWRAAIYSRTRKRSAGCPVCAGAVKQRK